MYLFKYCCELYTWSKAPLYVYGLDDDNPLKIQIYYIMK